MGKRNIHILIEKFFENDLSPEIQKKFHAWENSMLKLRRKIVCWRATGKLFVENIERADKEAGRSDEA